MNGKVFPYQRELLTLKEISQRTGTPSNILYQWWIRSGTFDPPPPRPKWPPRHCHCTSLTPKFIEAFQRRIDEIREGKRNDSEYVRALPFHKWDTHSNLDPIYNDSLLNRARAREQRMKPNGRKIGRTINPVKVLESPESYASTSRRSDSE